MKPVRGPSAPLQRALRPLLQGCALALVAAHLGAQETPPPNRVIWFAVFPEPLPQGENQLSLEVSSQFLRPDSERGQDGRATARMDGEEWQLTGDLALPLGPGRINLRTRMIDRSGGVADQAIFSFHKLLGTPGGGRKYVPKYRFLYHLERDGVVVAHLERPRTQLMDLDIVYVLPMGDGDAGGRLGASLQLPTGRREDFSGSGGTDALVGGAAWKRWGPWRLHGQAEWVFIGLPQHSPYRAVLADHHFARTWVGGGWQGQGSGLLSGLGLDLTFAYSQNPYRVGIPRIDGPALQQHWTFSHRALPRWRLGLSEEAGSYVVPDITGFVSYRF